MQCNEKVLFGEEKLDQEFNYEGFYVENLQKYLGILPIFYERKIEYKEMKSTEEKWFLCK